MKFVLATTLVGALATGCASTETVKITPPEGAEFVSASGDQNPTPGNFRMVAQMDDIGDYTLDGSGVSAAKSKTAKKKQNAQRRTRYSSSFGY